MKKSNILATAAVALGLSWGAVPAGAQTSTATKPVIVKQAPSKLIWLSAEVIHADARSMIVREQDNERAIHTFTYGPKIQDAMQKISDQGGYQSGDKVKILHEPSKDVAIKIQGKPSKPL